MARPKAIDRLGDLIEAAAEVLIRKGYRRTQMADITAAMGLSPGAIYRYVESKEALFDLVVRASASPELPLSELSLPIPTPQPGATLAYLQDLLAREAGLPALEEALATDRPADVRAELEAIARGLFRAIARNHRGLRIMERSALEWPELAELWFGRTRNALLDALTAYFEKRTRAGLIRAAPDTVGAARVFSELTAYFAMHRHYDPTPTRLSDEAAEAAAVDALVHVYLKE